MQKKKAKIQIKDLNVDLDELQKKDPKVLEKIRGGWTTASYYCASNLGCAGGRPATTAVCAGGGWPGGPKGF